MKKLLFVLGFILICSNAYSAENKQSYPFVGGSLFYPALVNATGGYHFDNGIGLRGTAGYYPEVAYGAQINALMNLSKQQNFEMNFSLAAGYRAVTEFNGYEDEFEGASYFGGFFDINLYGIFLEAGLSFMSDNGEKSAITISDDIGLSFQLGYVWRFND